MAVPFYPENRPYSSSSTGSRVVDEAEESIEAAESCVRLHPESAVWTAFATGLLLGAVLGWVALDRREHAWRREVGGLAEKLRSKFAWG